MLAGTERMFAQIQQLSIDLLHHSQSLRCHQDSLSFTTRRLNTVNGLVSLHVISHVTGHVPPNNWKQVGDSIGANKRATRWEVMLNWVTAAMRVCVVNKQRPSYDVGGWRHIPRQVSDQFVTRYLQTSACDSVSSQTIENTLMQSNVPSRSCPPISPNSLHFKFSF